MTATATRPPTGATPAAPSPWRYVVLVVVIGFAAFWIWALFFASKESINGIGEDGWTDRAQAICEAADAEREDLADFRRVDADDPTMLAALVPLWAADYRTYLQDRRTYAADLRAGDDGPFAETVVDGIPISDKVARFAADNRMPACAPPTDLG